MIPRIPIPVSQLVVRPFHLLDKQWFLLAAGDFAAGKYNAMTVSWGGLGTMWDRPVVQVVVRPHRYTFEFMEEYPDFTVSAFPEASRKALNLLGTVSGRGRNKIAESGLTVRAGQAVGSPVFGEAELVLECRKLFFQDIDPAGFVDKSLERNYPRKDYHRVYVGEVVAASASAAFATKG